MDPAASPDPGNSVFFEHVNFRVPDHRLATAFFIMGLGLTRDPHRQVGIRNMWVNVGQQQFHLPIGEPPRFAGEIGLVLPHPDSAAKVLAELAPEFKGTRVDCEPDGGTWVAHDPWGRRLRLHPPGRLPGRMRLGIPYVEFWVRPGTANGLAAFYRDVLGIPAHLDEAGPAAIATVGPQQSLRFRERDDVEPSGQALHVCLYLARFWETFEELERRDLVFEGITTDQFRFLDFRPQGADAPLYSIEHEMRSLHHVDFRRPLVNRTPTPGDPAAARA